MRQVQISRAAERDLDDIWQFIATESGNVNTALSVVTSITDAFALLAQLPGAGTLRAEFGSEVHGFPVGNYIIYYRASHSVVNISRVLHGMRDQQAAYRRT